MNYHSGSPCRNNKITKIELIYQYNKAIIDRAGYKVAYEKEKLKNEILLKRYEDLLRAYNNNFRRQREATRSKQLPTINS
jgi:RecA-family ATPase